jgi:methanogenic corrinoid protein MtbC1
MAELSYEQESIFVPHMTLAAGIMDSYWGRRSLVKKPKKP